MQVPFAVGRVIAGVTSVSAVTYVLPRVLDASGLPLLNLVGLRHQVGGTSPAALAQLETSDDLETWAGVGSSVDIATAAYQRVVVTAKNDPYGRYLRAKVMIQGTNVFVNFSLWVETFQSS